ncbi:MAG: ureidoglycolate lyase, partial [Proteobacteria bacterium]
MMLSVHPLTRAGFEPFGDVIDIDGAQHYTINAGHAERYNDLADLDIAAAGGRPLVNIFRARPWPFPIRILEMERHPLSSQAFVPLRGAPFLIVVAPPGDELRPEQLRAFSSAGRQGVNYHRGVWHHALLALEADSDFLVIDRGGPEANCDVVSLDQYEIVL